MKTETEIRVKLSDITTSEHLHNECNGFVIKMFFSCSRTDTKCFKITGAKTSIDQTLNICNISGRQLEFWLCNTSNKILANAVIALPNQSKEFEVSINFNMTNTELAKVNASLSISKRQIEKIIYVEPDQQLLKRVEDPYEKIRKQQEEARKAKQQEELLNASKQAKKAAITVSQYSKKDVPF